ncbi:MAG: sulfatase-like hydrolase/transferase [Bacteroidetes bacterium]|nr:sulfatase-like hydrolase/transferase [Bacteroidota bacterium]MDA1120426.1 sulfatase-like hydrolase/transferase [Bacteroidota bacterium]
MLGSETDPPLTTEVVNFLNNQKKQPFFLAVSYHNPHDICFYSRKDGWVSPSDSLLDIRYYGFEYQLPKVVGTHPSQFPELPPLPANHEMEQDEPQFLTDKRQYHEESGLETHLANQEFGDLEWRGYLNTYYRLTEMVDVEIGKVLDALEANNLNDNTIIVFTSDHGDGAAAHKWSAKLNLYQEPSTVPLIISWPGTIAKNRIDQSNLVSQIDIVPTLCDYAGIAAGVQFTGKSLRPILENSEAKWREYLIVELGDYAPDRSRRGRMIRTQDYKYNIFSSGVRNEQLFSMVTDPLETQNMAFNQNFDGILQEHLGYLQDWIEVTDDTFVIPKLNRP